MIPREEWLDADDNREMAEDEGRLFEECALELGLDTSNPLDVPKIVARYDEILAASDLENYRPVRDMRRPHWANQKRSAVAQQAIRDETADFIARNGRAPTARDLTKTVRVPVKGTSKPLELRQIQRHLAAIRVSGQKTIPDCTPQPVICWHDLANKLLSARDKMTQI
ncbi:MAG: hypothetical protein M3N97_00945 [Pseudomonadota bacterium]|nr:hypothetical protein [Pseudomonadota bacterium]